MSRSLVIFAALVLLANADAWGQTPTQADFEALDQLSPAERERLLESLGSAPAEASLTTEKDVSKPETVAPRELPRSLTEKELAQSEEDEVEVDLVLQPIPVEAIPEDAQSIREAFLGFVEESRPLTVDRKIEQFGYELFAGAPSTFAPATDIPVGPDYIIGPGDEIRLQFYGKRNLSLILVVDRDGQIHLPDIGPLSVAGLTFDALQEYVVCEVQERMIGVEASVTMGRLRSIRIFALGDVFQPGSYTVSGLSTITNALLACGGVKKIGSLRRVQLKRDGQTISELDLYDLLLRGDTSDDVRLMPGDVIFIPSVGPLVGVAGQVLRPAIYELKGTMTAWELIELAGGLQPHAYSGLIQLERVEDDRRVTHDMSILGAGERILQAGDLLKIYPVLDREEEIVFLRGNVLRPGTRQFFSGMTILDLIPSPEELLPETYFRYGLIERESELNRESEYITFSLENALINEDPAANLQLRARDKVYVFHRTHFRDVPYVITRGEVRSPGRYAYKKDMTVLDLLLAAGGLTRDAWLQQAELLRTAPSDLSVTKLEVDLERVLDDGPENIELADMDELVVHSIWEFRSRGAVKILGDVNHAGSYPFFEGMRVSDLVFAGGNLKESAYRREAELTRYDVVDGERRELHHVVLDLESVLAGSDDADILLRSYDRLLIRRITNWRDDKVIHVTGEIAFPGSYPIEEGERLSRVIQRFGGFLDEAYLPAAVFAREQVRGIQAEQLDRMADMLEADLARLSVSNPRSTSNTDMARRQVALEVGNQLLTELRNAKASGRLVISLDTAERLAHTQYDIVLEDGDRLHVPKRPSFVMVMGQVNNQTAFQYEEGKRASHYVELAGGTTRFSDSGNMYIIKADGSIQKSRRSRVEPGDVIVVPEKLERFTGMQFILDLSQVLYQIGLAAASAHTVGIF